MMPLTVFKGKTVLVTGHTGFKGSWLSLWLKNLGANVSGVSIGAPTEPSCSNATNLLDYVDDYFLDICDVDSLKTLVDKIQPDFVFHLAAQALVSHSYVNPLKTFETNALGSVNILEALRSLNKPVVAVMITSDKAYNNVEWVWGYRETDCLGGKDPYSSSKAMAELAIYSFVKSYFDEANSNVRVGIARAGNVIGGGDWAVNRLIPDCMKSWSTNSVVNIRNPSATRPWQHVLEPLSGYLILGANLAKNATYHGEAFNFGPSDNLSYPVSSLIDELGKFWGNVRWKDISEEKEHLYEAGLLKLNCDKALFNLNWRSTLEFEETVKMTAEWYKVFYQTSNKSMFDFTISQIVEYTNLAKSKSIAWACDD
jgi:CDP-glucose 4,6-dehydratase